MKNQKKSKKIKKIRFLSIVILTCVFAFVACEKHTETANQSELANANQTKDANVVFANCVKPEGFFEIPIPEALQSDGYVVDQVVAYCEGQTVTTTHAELGDIEIQLFMQMNAFDEILSISFNGAALGITAEEYRESGINGGDDIPGANETAKCINHCGERFPPKFDENGNNTNLKPWRKCKWGCWGAFGARVISHFL